MVKGMEKEKFKIILEFEESPDGGAYTASVDMSDINDLEKNTGVKEHEQAYVMLGIGNIMLYLMSDCVRHVIQYNAERNGTPIDGDGMDIVVRAGKDLMDLSFRELMVVVTKATDPDAEKSMGRMYLDLLVKQESKELLTKVTNAMRNVKSKDVIDEMLEADPKPTDGGLH